MPVLTRVIILLILLSGFSPSLAQDISAELTAQIEKLEEFAVRVRGLEPLEAVDRRFPTRDEAIAEIQALFAAEIPPEMAAQLNVFYAAFDFLPAGADYVSLYLSALEAQIGGFYDPETGAMNTLLLNGGAPGDELPLLEQIVYVHEFIHALQDQHFDLQRLDEQTRDHPDQAQAVLALVEGDATLVMNLYTQEIAQANPLGTTLRLLAQGFSTNTLFMPPGLPDIISRELLSSYTDGAAFVSAIYAQGGWEAVNAAFQPENWPQSTEQILHPAKYLDGEGPLPVELADFTPGPEWDAVWDTTFGQFYLREYLRTQLTSSAAARAAAGWGGDRYRIYQQRDTGALAWVMRIAWDTPDDAAEFSDAYTDFLTKRFEGVVAEDSCWSTVDEALCFSDTNAEHRIAFAPTLALAQELLASQG